MTTKTTTKKSTKTTITADTQTGVGTLADFVANDKVIKKPAAKKPAAKKPAAKKPAAKKPGAKKPGEFFPAKTVAKAAAAKVAHLAIMQEVKSQAGKLAAKGKKFDKESVSVAGRTIVCKLGKKPGGVLVTKRTAAEAKKSVAAYRAVVSRFFNV